MAKKTTVPENVKKAVRGKIGEYKAKVGGIERRSDVAKELKELAKWLEGDEPVKGLSGGDKDQAKKELKKAADNLLKRIGEKAK